MRRTAAHAPGCPSSPGPGSRSQRQEHAFPRVRRPGGSEVQKPGCHFTPAPFQGQPFAKRKAVSKRQILLEERRGGKKERQAGGREEAYQRHRVHLSPARRAPCGQQKGGDRAALGCAPPPLYCRGAGLPPPTDEPEDREVPHCKVPCADTDFTLQAQHRR